MAWRARRRHADQRSWKQESGLLAGIIAAMDTPGKLLHFLRSQEAAMIQLLGQLVRIESSSFDKPGVDRVVALLAAEWRRRGARVKRLRNAVRGDILRAELWKDQARPAGQILVLGHTDTVYERGTLAGMPFRVSGGRACGPATLDMKSGLVLALHAVDALRHLHVLPKRRVVFLWTSDEEIGSDCARRVIEREARRSRAVLVLEPGTGLDGRLKTARKGIGGFDLLVTGRAAHAGVNPQAGVNAVHELALQIAHVVDFNDPRRGITVNADVIAGGTRTNVIAERAHAAVDVRCVRAADMKRLERKFRGLRPILPGARLEVRGGMNRFPMERRVAAELFARAKKLGGQMGLRLEESATGGGSDGNLTAELGIPTLDGMGGVGAGAHTPGEYVITRFLPERAAVLAAMLADL